MEEIVLVERLQPLERVQQQSVEAPMPLVLKGTVDTAVDVPVPRVMEETATVVHRDETVEMVRLNLT